MNPRAMWLIGRSVLVEAIRRKEIYAIVLISCLLIAITMSLDFFKLEGVSVFYYDMALKTMSVATALTCIVLAARQLPREFEARTIYPLLAKPVRREAFLLGKLLGVFLATVFCLALFMFVFVVSMASLDLTIHWGLFLQYVYLQLLMMLLLASMSFMLSMMLNLDAAICIGILFFVVAATYSSMLVYLYDYGTAVAQLVFKFLNYALPQLVLFDLSGKTSHGATWEPLALSTMGQLTLYGLFFTVMYMVVATVLFRRRVL